MELRQLRYLIGVCEAGGVLAASRKLHIAQPALSHHIAALEAELGVQLFVRSNRGMTLTPPGKALVEHARVVMADIERAKNAVWDASAQVRGDVALGLPTTVALVATLPIFQATRERYPDVRLKIVESHSGFLTEWLHAGRLDLSVLFMSRPDPGIAHKPLLEESLVWVTAASQARSAREVTLKKLVGYPLVLPAKEHGLRRIVDDACAQAGVVLDVIGEIDSLPNIKKVVQAGMAGTILSPGAVAEEVRAGTLAITTIGKPHIVRTIASAVSVTRPPTPAAAAVATLITERMRHLVQEKLWPAQWVGG